MAKGKEKNNIFPRFESFIYLLLQPPEPIVDEVKDHLETPFQMDFFHEIIKTKEITRK